MPQNLCDAALQQLRASPCAALFGDTWDPHAQSGVKKFYADFAGQPAEPYLVIQEPSESRDYMTASEGDYRPYIATGRLHVAIYAADRQQARDLGDAVGAALNDAPLMWPGAELMYLRVDQASFAPTAAAGPSGTPTTFVRLVPFDYQFHSSL